MNTKQKNILLLLFFIILFVGLNYNFLDKFVLGFLVNYEIVEVERVIDGDTIVVNGSSRRLLGINSPEKGEKYSLEAKEYLENWVLEKDVGLKYGAEKEDRYGRGLVYTFVGTENINLKLVEQGFANYYFPSGKDSYYNNFRKAWEKCIGNNINLCEKSIDVCGECVELKIFNFEDEVVIFENVCDFDCDLNNWEIKDEGRKTFLFENFVLKNGEEIIILVDDLEDEEGVFYWSGKNYVWTNTGDTLFLRDREGRLVLWESY